MHAFTTFTPMHKSEHVHSHTHAQTNVSPPGLWSHVFITFTHIHKQLVGGLQMHLLATFTHTFTNTLEHTCGLHMHLLTTFTNVSTCVAYRCLYSPHSQTNEGPTNACIHHLHTHMHKHACAHTYNTKFHCESRSSKCSKEVINPHTCSPPPTHPHTMTHINLC